MRDPIAKKINANLLILIGLTNFVVFMQKVVVMKVNAIMN